jgi:drug/metabolite transporter (DMT)-like permease
MNWFFLALLAPVIYSVNVFLDKYLIEARIPDYRGLPIFGSILAGLVIFFLILSGKFELLSFQNIFLIVLTGISSIWAFALYLEALIEEEGSVVIILLQLVPVIVLVLSYLFLGESLTLKHFFGFGLLFFSSVIASLKKSRFSFKLSRALVFILISDFFWAMPYIFIKFTSGSISFLNLMIYESIGIIIGACLLYLFVRSIRQAFLKTIRKINKSTLGLVFLNEGIFLLGKTVTYLAVLFGPVALIAILGSTQIFSGILLGIILTLLIPKTIKEDISKKNLVKKSFLGLLAFLGIYFIS